MKQLNGGNMQRRLKIYLENSLISMYFQDDAPYLRDLTRQFWKETLPHFEAYVSDIVLAEIRAIEDNNLRKGLERLIRKFEIIEITENVLELSNIYLSYRRLPRGDALHLAEASTGEWNL